MSDKSFQLRPFASSIYSGLSFQIDLQISQSQLNFHFRLSGEPAHLEQLVWPVRGEAQRRDGLWQSTCFELFMGNIGESSYFEFNFSPSGDWNAYHFTSERQGMRPAHELSASPLQGVKRSASVYEMNGAIDLQKLSLRSNTLEFSATAVLNWSGKNEYWAITHAGAKPDFHLRNSFVK